MVFLSDVIGKPVRDVHGERIAAVKDLIVRINDQPYPTVTGAVARQSGRDFFIKPSAVAAIDETGITLSTTKLNVERFAKRPEEVLLAKHVLDRQLIDVDGRRVIRVNDLQIIPSEGGYKVGGVDISPRALLRRLGLRRLARTSRPDDLIDWADVEYFASEDSAVRLRVSHEKLSKLHPADIARLVDTVSFRQGAEIIASLDTQTAAETMEEMTPERQADLVEGMDSERAADILELMAPDDAADLLGDLEEAKARQLLDLMDEEVSDDVEELLSYEEDSAGGLMTTGFATVTPDMTVHEAMAHLQRMDPKPTSAYYIYVVDSLDLDPPVLVGVVSLRELVFRGLDCPISDIMTTEVRYAEPDTSLEDVARLMSEYNLLALPVLEDGHILGIIAVDDVMERLAPVHWRERLPKLFR